MTPPAPLAPAPPRRAPAACPPHSCDVVVVGGGLVGATLAIALARHGVPVTVLERDAGPVPDLLRGELVMPAGVAVLEALGLLPALAPHVTPVRGVELRHPAWPRGPVAIDYAATPAPPGVPAAAWAPRGLCGWRRPLYEALRAAARACPGVTWRDGWALDALAREGDRWRLAPRRSAAASAAASDRRPDRRPDHRPDDRPDLLARVVLACDGQQSRARALAGFAAVEDHRATLVQGVVARGPGAAAFAARGRVVVGAHALGAAFAFPFPDGRVRLTFEHALERRAEVEGALGPDADDAVARHLDLVRAALPDVWADLGGAALEAEGPLAVQPGRTLVLGGVVREGLALAGDAAGCLDPFSGHGMALGLQDAAALAAAVSGAVAGAGTVAGAGDGADPRSLDRALRAYEADRQRRLLARREATAPLAWSFLAGADPLAQALAARVGDAWSCPARAPLLGPALAARFAGFDLPGTSPGLALAGLGLLG